MLSSLLPVFPLPNVVLFPHVSLPLHVFEPRYREMLADTLERDRLIGMVLLKAGFEAEYEGHPPIYAVGCAGLVTHAERMPDGRSNIILQGMQKFRLLDEDHERAYRRARVEPLPDLLRPDEAGLLRASRRRLEAQLGPLLESHGAEARIPPAISDVELVNGLAQFLPLESVEKQALLECDGVLARCEALSELLEMKALLARTTEGSTRTH